MAKRIATHDDGFVAQIYKRENSNGSATAIIAEPGCGVVKVATIRSLPIDGEIANFKLGR